jgi:hypothetical protein
MDGYELLRDELTAALSPLLDERAHPSWFTRLIDLLAGVVI